MTDAMLKRKVATTPGFVNAKRFDNSIVLLEERYPDGCPDHVLATALMIPEAEVQGEYDKIVVKMRDLMGVPV